MSGAFPANTTLTDLNLFGLHQCCYLNRVGAQKKGDEMLENAADRKQFERHFLPEITRRAEDEHNTHQTLSL